ncbi:MAG: hypothetical protein GF383_02470 [Candidatus Lokiarchaeota archaeon]|nr:hypothetical protein [Candidatus Lokiarchaeota archaeon]MBD3338277.1 hypothetical protein [Candidatus Lokiarchaeota archaeon]
MAAQNAKTKTRLWTCEKCGSEMLKRKLIIKDSKTAKKRLIDILQCQVCKHWFKFT